VGGTTYLPTPRGGVTSISGTGQMEWDEFTLPTSRAVSRPPPVARAAADRLRGGWREDHRGMARARGLTPGLTTEAG